MYADMPRLGALGSFFFPPLRLGEDPAADFFAFFLAGALTVSPLALFLASATSEPSDMSESDMSESSELSSSSSFWASSAP